MMILEISRNRSQNLWFFSYLLVATRSNYLSPTLFNPKVKPYGVFWGPRGCYIFLNNIFNYLKGNCVLRTLARRYKK